MKQLIKFKQFSESVSQNEFESLMPEISEIIGGKDVLVSLLYDHFKSKSENIYNGQLEQINHLLAAIVNENSALTEPKLDKIYQSLINNICSYLGLISYTQFERCNRTIFIASRSPFQLYHINQRDICVYLKYCIKNNQIIDRKRFGRIKSLRLREVPTSSEWNKANLMFSNLQSLQIVFKDPTLLNAIIHSKSFKLLIKQLTTLKLYNASVFSPTLLISDMLQKPSNLQFLDLQYVDHPPTIHPNAKRVFRKLSGLSLYCDNVHSQRLISSENDMVNACCSGLKSFHTNWGLNKLNLNHMQFPDLTELCLQQNYDPKVSKIISKFKHLKRLRFDLCESELEQDMEMELSIKFINELLSLNELESIDFGMIPLKTIPKLTKLIQNGLMIHRKKKLKIYMFCTDVAIGDLSAGDLCIDLEVFVNSLEFLISEDFMLIFSADDVPESEDEKIGKWLNSLDDERFWWVHYDLWCGYFVVANKGCKINTCQREWMMECGCCKSSSYVQDRAEEVRVRLNPV